MIEHEGGKRLESKPNQKKKIKESFSEVLYHELTDSNHSWENCGKLPNQYAYKLIKEGHGDIVLKHLENFRTTRQLLEKLILEKSKEESDMYNGDKKISSLEFNKDVLDKILRHAPDLLWKAYFDGIYDYGVDDNTLKRYLLTAYGFKIDDLDVENKNDKGKCKEIYNKYFSMDEKKLELTFNRIEEQESYYHSPDLFREPEDDGN